MCLIIIATEQHPTKDTLIAANRANGDGIGIAYRETKTNKKSKLKEVYVAVKRNITLEQLQQLVPTLQFPYVIHFRMATVGGVNPKLCHPFKIDETSDIEQLEYMTQKRVLFQNGHYTDWKEKLVNTCIAWKAQIPKGAMSDTRAMAILTNYLGEALLHIEDSSRWVVYSNKKCLFYGIGWVIKEGCIYSNEYYKTNYSSDYGKYWNGGYWEQGKDKSVHWRDYID